MNETTSQRTARLLSMSNAQLIMHAQDLTIQRDELLASERKLSDAYIRLREKLSAFDTPAAPTAEQVYEHTEAKLDRLLDQRDELLADVAEEAAVREKLATLLAETAVALKGPEAALFRHSWHDLAEVAAGVVKHRDELLAALEQFVTWGRMQHKAQSKGCYATFDMMSLKDEIDLAEAAITSVRGAA